MIRSHLVFLIMRPVVRIMRVFELTAVTLALIMGMYIPVSGKPLIHSSAYPESLTVGDKFLYINRVSVPPGTRIEALPPGDHLGEATVVSDISRLSESADSLATFACTLAVYKSGEFEIPTFTFSTTDSVGNVEEITGDSLYVSIQSVLPQDTTGMDIADIRGPYRLKGPIWPYLVIPPAAAFVFLAAYLLYRRFRKIPEIPELPSRPAWEVAFERLDVLKGKRHYDFGRVKQYYFELSLIVRAYVEGRYGFPAAERTTFELESDLRMNRIDGKFRKALFEFFDRADLAKFAKVIPSRTDADSDLSMSYDFVQKTIPAIEETRAGSLSAEERSRNVQV